MLKLFCIAKDTREWSLKKSTFQLDVQVATGKCWIVAHIYSTNKQTNKQQGYLESSLSKSFLFEAQLIHTHLTLACSEKVQHDQNNAREIAQ